jgi:hypothetical protein
VYHPEDFEKIFNPVTLVEYGPAEVLSKLGDTHQFGPWDSLSGLWYEHYYGGTPMFGGVTMSDHGTRSKNATSRILELQEMLEEE